jgi:prephenate dehydrogenase
MQPHIQTVAVIGVGLIGGSICSALSRKGIEVRGVSSGKSLRKALDMGIIDGAYEYDRINESLQGAQVVFVCSPLLDIGKRIPSIFEHADRGTIITDVGSTKAVICRIAEESVTRGVYFLGGHPMAGSERRGVNHANPYLFYDAVWVLTPLKNTPRKVLNSLSSLISDFGAKVMVLDPELHDRIAANVSHLPQLLAVSLLNHLAVRDDDLYRNLAAGGFRDMTRIASSSYSVWRDIIQTNSTEIEKALEAYQSALGQVRENLKTDRFLDSAFNVARKERQTIPRYSKGFLTPLIDIRVSVQDRPGELARITSLIYYHDVNIKDIEIINIREGEGGILRLGFVYKKEAEAAAKILRDVGYDVTLEE